MMMPVFGGGGHEGSAYSCRRVGLMKVIMIMSLSVPEGLLPLPSATVQYRQTVVDSLLQAIEYHIDHQQH